MYFEAIANNGIRKVKENLDNFNEVQEFCNKIEKRGFLNVLVTATYQNNEKKTINYIFNGKAWSQI